MAEVNLNIHGRDYGIACDDGQESRVMEVGNYVDSRVRGIASAGAASNENHLLVLTALVLADEVRELKDNIQTVQSHAPAVPQAEPQVVYQGLAEDEEHKIIESIERLAVRIESVADRLKRA